MKKTILALVMSVCSITLYAQDGDDEQSRESMAMDATATQWSFQCAYQWMPDYHTDDVNGAPRPMGLDNYV